MRLGGITPSFQLEIKMLCSQNSGKYLYGKYARERAKAMEDKEPFSQDQQDYLDITGTDGTAVHQDRTFKIATNPLDSNPLKQSQPPIDMPSSVTSSSRKWSRTAPTGFSHR